MFVPLDFIPFRLDAGGDVIVGAGEQGLVRWSARTGLQLVDAGASLSRIGGLGTTRALDLIAGSDFDGRAFRWTRRNRSALASAEYFARLAGASHPESSRSESSRSESAGAKQEERYRWFAPGVAEVVLLAVQDGGHVSPARTPTSQPSSAGSIAPSTAPWRRGASSHASLGPSVADDRTRSRSSGIGSIGPRPTPAAFYA